MLAKRKSNGKVIEVREWRGASDVVYSDPDMNRFYQASDLDFNVEEVAIDGWVARDKSGDLFIYAHKPERDYIKSCWEGEISDITHNNGLFPSLTWESEPLEVTVTIKPKKQ